MHPAQSKCSVGTALSGGYPVFEHAKAVESFPARPVHWALRFARAWVIAGLLFALGLPEIAVGKARSVLVLYSNSRLLPANVELDRALRQTIATTADRPVQIFDEFLDVPRGQAYVDTVSRYLREKYASEPPDVIVAVSEEALHFLLSNRAQIYPRVPIVQLAVSKASLGSLPALPPDVVGVPAEPDFSATVEQALRWHPGVRRLVVVTGASPWDLEWEARIREEAVRFQDRVAIEFLARLPSEAVRRRLAELRESAVVFTPGYFQDGALRTFTPRESIESMAAASAAPLYAPYSTFLGHGIVGGYMWTFESLGRQAGQIATDLLGGKTPESIHLPESQPTILNVDWRQIQRWGIDPKSIPADAIVHFKAPTFLEQHRLGAIIAVGAFMLQTALIAGLLVERHRRRAAELAVQKQRFELARAARFAVAGELTGSIAHQINQPLGAILSNAEAAELILDSGADRHAKLREILADIRRDDLRASEVIRGLRALLANQEVERRPFELNEAVSDVGSMLRAEAQRRRVTLDLRLATTAATTVGDPIQIQQVLMNLVLNAMDAVADMPDDRRTIEVSVENGAGGIAIAVRDRGRGIAPEHLPKVFDSFFTTKRGGMGLGLSIARSLVEAHGGRISAGNGGGEGAVFRIELPAPKATDSPPPAVQS